MKTGHQRDGESTVPVYRDFKSGVAFRDVMPVLASRDSFGAALEGLTEWSAPLAPDFVAGIDARGFILGGALADRLGCGFLAVRKAGKLPGETVGRTFSGEYSTDRIEVRKDLVPPGSRVLVHDDIVATGNSVAAAVEMLEELGATVVGITCLIEKSFLGGRSRVRAPFFSVYSFDA
ncbi:adenine phosphoribosyltransferase [Kitasatospora sp. NPDC018619]|uniref:adenine phosphoribosyltransferase n=1 Tax=unclassified Kitasatospora TaxID=2633591 RepID=UPI00378D8DAF